jgi:hypothetical protein
MENAKENKIKISEVTDTGTGTDKIIVRILSCEQYMYSIFLFSNSLCFIFYLKIYVFKKGQRKPPSKTERNLETEPVHQRTDRNNSHDVDTQECRYPPAEVSCS